MPLTGKCAVCRNHDARVGLLCERCRVEIVAHVGLVPQQVIVTSGKPTRDLLIDQWGRGHALDPRTMIGRALDGNGMLIIEASVSRHHAHLAREPDGWRLRDLGSSNGTFVNDALVTEPVTIKHGDRLTIGVVQFVLACGLGEVPDVSIDPAAIETNPALMPLADVEHRELAGDDTDVGLPSVPLRLVEPTGGGGGLLELGGISIQLSMNQAALIDLISRRMIEEAHLPAQVRGYVSTAELLRSLPWDTSDPDDNTVKQLIRRLRRLLIREGFGDLVESRQRFGYRLRVIPSR